MVDAPDAVSAAVWPIGTTEKLEIAPDRLTALFPLRPRRHIIGLARAAAGARHPRRAVATIGGRTAPIHEPRMTPAWDGTSPSHQDASAPREELGDLYAAVYAELRRVAHHHLGGERTGHTLGTTGLVHEAYLHLARLEHIRWPGRAYVLAAASQAMRRILIDYANARRTQKRGGGVPMVPLDDAVVMAVSRGDALLALDEALDRLAALNERAVRVVECRFYGGMSVEETAEALGTSPATVKREWTAARAFLNRELAQ